MKKPMLSSPRPKKNPGNPKDPGGEIPSNRVMTPITKPKAKAKKK